MRKFSGLMMRVVCAWCKKVLSDDGQGGPDSHGICGPCSKKMG